MRVTLPVVIVTSQITDAGTGEVQWVWTAFHAGKDLGISVGCRYAAEAIAIQVAERIVRDWAAYSVTSAERKA